MLGWNRYVKDKRGTIYKYTKNHTLDRGRIVYVELFGHMGHELTYPHLAVVLAEEHDWILIAPTSTKAYNDDNPYHIDLCKNNPEHGVDEDCALMLDHIRAISKQRVINKYRRLTCSQKLDEIDAAILKLYIPKLHEQMIKYETDIGRLKGIIEEKEKEISRLKEIAQKN
ncbi:type II toxin-antitoxin system PemK/MazF family toxin [Parageobacillus thermoglucosidasius]|uniref:type II toxin-antitoxin system PemK/MazF family toxin n=1 Tax=Parageobacillus thermoglucosidasius TaxID=1426 RepID=UPI003D281071